jgi:DNA-binding transcriptional regulator LsrR (DeoR family)
MLNGNFVRFSLSFAAIVMKNKRPFPDPYSVAFTYWKQLPVADRKWEKVAELLGLPVKGGDAKKILLNQLGRIVRRWEEQGYVRHQVLSPDLEIAHLAERVPSLEQALRDRFALRYAAVCNTSSIEEADERRHDDRIHQELGKWAGRILNVSLRGDGDVVGTGGGRGPYYAADNCRFKTRVAYPKRVVSLTGWINPTDHAVGSTTRFDADLVAGHLANRLHINELSRLEAGIVRDDKDRPRTIPIPDVTFALAGVGSLAGGHRLLNYQGVPELEGIRAELADLNALIAKIEGRASRDLAAPVHHWVGDLCNCLFVCVPPYPKRRQNQLQKDLDQLVRQINEKLLSPTLEQMGEICRRGAVMAVCGGRHKIIPIWHLLKSDKPVISHLITDKLCAESILAIESQTPDKVAPANVHASEKPR